MWLNFYKKASFNLKIIIIFANKTNILQLSLHSPWVCTKLLDPKMNEISLEGKLFDLHEISCFRVTHKHTFCRCTCESDIFWHHFLKLINYLSRCCYLQSICFFQLLCDWWYLYILCEVKTILSNFHVCHLETWKFSI